MNMGWYVWMVWYGIVLMVWYGIVVMVWYGIVVMVWYGYGNERDTSKASHASLTPCQGHFLLSWRVPLFSKCWISPPTTLRKLWKYNTCLFQLIIQTFVCIPAKGVVGSTSPQVPPSARGTFSTPQGGHTFLRTPAAPAPETIFFGHLGVTFTAVPVPGAIYSPLLPGPQLTNIVDFFRSSLRSHVPLVVRSSRSKFLYFLFWRRLPNPHSRYNPCPKTASNPAVLQAACRVAELE